MSTKSKHKWAFPARFRKGAYGWRGTAKASKNLKAAVSEIKKVAKKDPELGAEGATRLLEKLVPSIGGIDSSSGAIGSAVYSAVKELAEVLAAAAGTAKHARRVERVFEALQEDGYGYLDQLGDEFGRICGDEKLAEEWGLRLLETVRHAFTLGGYFPGTSACLSCLCRAGLHDELDEVLSLKSYKMWAWDRYRAEALSARGRVDEAIRLAESHLGEPGAMEFAEDLLIRNGRWQEAFEKYGPRMRSNTYLASFRATASKYPELDERTILGAYLERFKGDEGKWFATARSLGRYDLALALAQRGPCNPKTVYNGAKALRDKEPAIAFSMALAAIEGYLLGWAYEYEVADLLAACQLVEELAEGDGRGMALRDLLSRISRFHTSHRALVEERLGRVLASDG